MRIILCDDNPEILAALRGYLTDYFQAVGSAPPEIAAFASGDELLAHDYRADLAFLDVEMPGVSGIHVSAQLKERNPRIKIFIVTAFPEYLDEAMRVQVFRYLSKPIDKDRLYRNLKDALYQHSMESREYPITASDGVRVCRAEEIVCVETSSRRVLVHTTDGVLRSTENIEYWKKTLSLPCFFVPHRSFVINMRFVRAVGRDLITLKYGGQTKAVFLTRRKYTQFKDTYLMYLESMK